MMRKMILGTMAFVVLAVVCSLRYGLHSDTAPRSGSPVVDNTIIRPWESRRG